MAQPHHTPQPAVSKVQSSPYVEATFVFRDTLQKPIEGLSVQIKAGTGAPSAPAWKFGPDRDDSPATDPALAPPANSSAPMLSNSTNAVTDKDGYAVTIQNAARNQPIDVLVKNQRGEFVWKATVTPKKDVSAYTILSPEYHLEATTNLTPKEELEQNLDLPVVKEGEAMTIERLVKEFGPYIGWSQKVTEQGKVRKDTPTRKKDLTEDEQTHKKKTQITIEHHYKIVDTGKPTTVAFNVLGSRLNYPKSAVISDAQLKNIALELRCEAASIRAMIEQEASGSAYLANGLPKIRYERHFFFRLSLPEKERANYKKAKNPYPQFSDICFPILGGYGPEGLHQYERLVKAAAVDFEVALKSCSWGIFQIMGEYFKSCGCISVTEMVNANMTSVDKQAELFVSFLCNEKPVVIKGLKEKDWEKVAQGYNGKYWRTTNPGYAKNLEKFYNESK
ncbi:N-acetylmuramidase family protein [Paraburkholderia sediminicola]|uniref:N-acetylmuramidase family protein n=1 Tax=Paraburkholderia rhynchosiae TaxID=487049 RepID=A0ACC7NQG2_9BURK